jgi:hypothetical protein
MTYKRQHHGGRNRRASFAAGWTCWKRRWLASSLVSAARGRRLRDNELLHTVAGWVDPRNAPTSLAMASRRTEPDPLGEQSEILPESDVMTGKVVSPRLALMLSAICLFPFVLRSTAAQIMATLPHVIFEDHHDTSPPLRDLVQRARHWQGVPHLRGERDLENRVSGVFLLNQLLDPVVQASEGQAVETIGKMNFPGIGAGHYGYHDQASRPDANGAVGATQYVQIVNMSFAVFDKSNGKIVLGPADISSLWNGFGGPCERPISDPVAVYDKIAKRWVLAGMSALARPFFECIAVSQTSDATGAYNRYAIEFGALDYEKLGVWPDAYYLGVNAGGGGNGIACALQRPAMLEGKKAMAICFGAPGGKTFSTLLPADLDGERPPPRGAPNYIVGGINAEPNTMMLFKFHADFAHPKRSTLKGPVRIPVAAYTPACPVRIGRDDVHICIPQKGTRTMIWTLSDRLMYRNAYRNFGDHESIVVTHDVNVKFGTNIHDFVTGVRWYELRAAKDGNFTVFQQGTFAPDSNSRWMGSAAMDKAGDLAVGYSISSNGMYPSIRYAGRIPTDPLGTLEGEKSVVTGSSPGSLPWGDYSSMAVDPVDDCTFWYTTEYYERGQDGWSTRIASFRFSGCR